MKQDQETIYSYDNIGSSGYRNKAKFADKSDKTSSFRCEPIEPPSFSLAAALHPFFADIDTLRSDPAGLLRLALCCLGMFGQRLVVHEPFDYQGSPVLFELFLQLIQFLHHRMIHQYGV